MSEYTARLVGVPNYIYEGDYEDPALIGQTIEVKPPFTPGEGFEASVVGIQSKETYRAELEPLFTDPGEATYLKASVEPYEDANEHLQVIADRVGSLLNHPDAAVNMSQLHFFRPKSDRGIKRLWSSIIKPFML